MTPKNGLKTQESTLKNTLKDVIMNIYSKKVHSIYTHSKT
jgi:hypothetical protein